MRSRHYTNLLWEKAEEGSISWEAIAKAALTCMSEADVKDMAESEDLLSEEEYDE